MTQMHHITILSQKKMRTVFNVCAIMLSCTAIIQPAYANPEGGVVTGGAATIVNAPGELQIRQTTQKALIEWNSFNIGAGETTRFIQPNAGAIALNRVVNSTQFSAINGNLLANGRVLIINPNGVLIGNGAHVSTGGFLASTADMADASFMNADKALHFDRAGHSGAIVENRGNITVHDTGLVALVAPTVRNSGVIEGQVAKIQLAAGDVFGVDLYGDGLLYVAMKPDITPEQRHISVENTGSLVTDGGKILVTAAAASNMVDSVINMSGVVQAHGLVNQNGSIIITGTNAKITVNGKIDASGHNGGIVKIGGDMNGKGPLPTADRLVLTANAAVHADGGHNATATGNGGTVITWANTENNFFGTLTARGGAQGGNGGLVEVSAARSMTMGGVVNASAPHGAAGVFMLDPATLNIRNGSGPVLANVIYEDDVQALSVSGTNAVYSADTLTLEDLADNVLLGGSGDITLAGTNAVGGVVFDDLNDMITTTSGNLTIITAGSGGINIGSLRTGIGQMTLTSLNGGNISTRNLTVDRMYGENAELNVTSSGTLDINGNITVNNVDTNPVPLPADAVATLTAQNDINVVGTITVSSNDNDQPYINTSSRLDMESTNGDIFVGGAINLNSQATKTSDSGDHDVTATTHVSITANNGNIMLADGLFTDALGVYSGVNTSPLTTIVGSYITLNAGDDIIVNNGLEGLATATATNARDGAHSNITVASTGGEVYFNTPNNPTARAGDGAGGDPDAQVSQPYVGLNINETATVGAGQSEDTAHLSVSGLHTVTVTANAQAKTFGAPDPALTYSAVFNYPGSGAVPAGFFTGGLNRAPGETVAGSPYAINQGSLTHITTSTGAYTIQYVGNNLTISTGPPVPPTPPTPNVQSVNNTGQFFDIKELGRPIISVDNQVTVFDEAFEPAVILTMNTDVSIASNGTYGARNLETASAADLAQIETAAGGGPESPDIACANAFLADDACAVQQ